jgi:type II secretory pathway pseudopilin PulG
MRRNRKYGFTLFEVVLALALGTLALLSARLLVSQSEDAERRFEEGVALRDQEANGLRVARRLSANAFQGSDSTTEIQGDADHAEFQSWCQVLTGSWSRCRVRLWTRQRGSVTDLYVTDRIPGKVLVTSLAGEGKLAYLSRDELGDRWFSVWTSRMGAPLALAFTSIRDTITLAIGSR